MTQVLIKALRALRNKLLTDSWAFEPEVCFKYLQDICEFMHWFEDEYVLP